MTAGKILLVFLVMLGTAARAQFSYSIDQSIIVKKNGTTLSMPWGGGLNSPQFNTMDVNGDGTQDLVLFDRTADKILTFANHQSQYSYAPEYENMFPVEVTQWMLLRDINCDGKKDIFTSDPFGMRAFVNITPSGGGPLKWREFNPGFPILTIGFSGTLNLQMNGSDIPGIDDVDGDGDLDVLDARFSGIGSLEWHKNMSIENTGTCDSLQFKRITQTWGNLEECDCGSYLYAPGTCPIDAGRSTHASGKSILSLDMDNDGDNELIFSEEDCSRLYLFKNEGTPDDAVFTDFTLFPNVVHPLNMPLFPAAYHEDVDFDGVVDIIAAPNIPLKTVFDTDFSRSVSFFKNTGTNQLPNFSLVQNDFLQNQMIDVGDNAVPLFIDEDGDGDLDMFIGNFSGRTPASTLFFYENTGTITSPAFEFVNDDYANLSTLNVYNFKPQFADMTGDGRPDLAFTSTNLFTGATRLQFVTNVSQTGLDISDIATGTLDFDFGYNENLYITDVNLDGKNDILVGRTTGNLEYWMNTGTTETMNFTLKDSHYLGLGNSSSRQNLTAASADLDADGRTDLVVGNQHGALTLYTNYREWDSTFPPSDSIIVSPLTGELEPADLGGRIWPVVANLLNSDKPDIIVGNTLGGIHRLRSDDSHVLPPEPVIDLYPNPAPKGDGFLIQCDRNISVQFFSSMGIKVAEDKFLLANRPYQVSTQMLASGLYIARFSMKGKIYNRKFVVY